MGTLKVSLGISYQDSRFKLLMLYKTFLITGICNLAFEIHFDTALHTPF